MTRCSSSLRSAMKLVLIVDDSRVVRRVAQRLFSDFGFSTREAPDGRAALEVCKATMPDAVLLDWNMPVMDGMDFLVALRALPNGFVPKVIFCTTVTEQDQIAKAIEAGADEYVMKPFDAQIIESKLVEVGLLSSA